MELSVPYAILLGMVVLSIGISLVYTIYHKSNSFRCSVMRFLSKFFSNSFYYDSKECNNKSIQSYEIFFTNKDKIAEELAAYILACYEKSDRASLGHDVDCFEIEIKNKPSENVTDSDINNKLPLDYRSIFRMTSNITSRGTLLIIYNSTSGLIEVI